MTVVPTPGPWWYVPNQCWNIKALCSDDICSVSHNDVGVEEMHANAHLIAAAPDLLEALEAVQAMHQRYCDRVGAADDWARSLKSQVDAAITKATEEPNT